MRHDVYVYFVLSIFAMFVRFFLFVGPINHLQVYFVGVLRMCWKARELPRQPFAGRSRLTGLVAALL